MKVCICRICECGRHKCAHQKAKGTIPTDPTCQKNFTSETKQSYQPTDLQGRVIPKKPIPNLMNASGPMQKTTTTAVDYTPKSATATLVRPKRLYNAPTTKMYDKTTYRKDYCPENEPRPTRDPAAHGKPNNLNVSDEKMETKTTQLRDYVPWNPKDAEACRGKPITEGREGTLTLRGQEFTGQSETTRCYQRPLPTVPERGKGKQDHLQTQGKFEGRTVTNLDYTAKKAETRVKAKGKKDAMRWPNDNFKTVTTYKTDFKAYRPSQRMPLFCPKESELKPSEAAFEGHTSYKIDFLAPLAEPRVEPPWKPHRKYKKPEVAIENETTYRKDFAGLPEEIVPERGRGRELNLKVSGEPMATMTTHRKDFGLQTGFEPSKSTKQTAEYNPPTIKFADETVTRRDYTGEAGDRVFQIKQDNNLKVGTSPMDLTTMTRKDYQCNLRECPAALLKLGDKDMAEQYKFIEADRGHEYYEKLRKKTTTA